MLFIASSWVCSVQYVICCSSYHTGHLHTHLLSHRAHAPSPVITQGTCTLTSYHTGHLYPHQLPHRAHAPSLPFFLPSLVGSQALYELKRLRAAAFAEPQRLFSLCEQAELLNAVVEHEQRDLAVSQCCLALCPLCTKSAT